MKAETLFDMNLGVCYWFQEVPIALITAIKLSPFTEAHRR